MARRFGSWFAALWLALMAGPAASFAEEKHVFKPENDFQLPPWVSIHIGPIDMSINKAVFYLALAAFATILTFWLLTRRLHKRPGPGQTVIETVYDFCVVQLGKANMPERVMRLWFPYVSTLFIFIWFCNMTSYIPLPVNTEEKIAGWLPGFSIYAATANLSVPLALAFISVIGYHVQGVKAQGAGKYLRGWVPSGVPGAMKAPLFIIESISHAARLISLSVRLFANMLAGHLLIIMMLGMASLLGLLLVVPLFGTVAVGFYLLEVVLIASLQAFIFAVLTAIYIGEAVESH